MERAANNMRFDSKDFLGELSQELITNFGRAKKVTTPGLKGAARENEVRLKLESLLPPGVGVGTGCVIDSEGNVSKQQDIILYEKQLCPKFTFSGSDEASYYPCEGVIATGEIKSSIGRNELEDIFQKSLSVKKLRRLAITTKSQLIDVESVCYRKYLSQTVFDSGGENSFNQDANSSDQIWTFALAGDFSVSQETLSKHLEISLSETKDIYSPNFIATLNSGVLYPINKFQKKIYNAVSEGTGYGFGFSEAGAFQYLLSSLYRVIRNGRTVDFSTFTHYIVQDPMNNPLTIEFVVDK